MVNSELEEKFYVYLCSGSCILIVVFFVFFTSLFPSAFLLHNPLIPVFFFIIIAIIVFSPSIIIVYFKNFHKNIKIDKVDFDKIRKEKEGIKNRFLHRQEIAEIKKRAEEFYKLKFGVADAAHVAFAEHCGAEFISCDDSLLKKCYKHKVKVWCGNPVTFCEKEEIK